METMMKARIAYDGPALADGSMDVRELAPALLAFANLVSEIHNAAGIKEEIRVALNADSIRRGSFDVTMFLHPKTLLEHAKLFVGAADDSGLSALMQILGWGKDIGIFSFLKWLRGRMPSSAEPTSDGRITISLPDGNSTEVNINVWNVYKNAKCRDCIEAVIHPVTQEGIDGFELRNPGNPGDKEPIERVTKEDAPSFTAIHCEDASLETQDQEMYAILVAPNFADGKWRLNNGEHPFYADILDQKFLQKVKQGEIYFRRGDLLQIRFHTLQTLKNGKLSNSYIVTEVIGLQHPPEQMTLF